MTQIRRPKQKHERRRADNILGCMVDGGAQGKQQTTNKCDHTTQTSRLPAQVFRRRHQINDLVATWSDSRCYALRSSDGQPHSCYSVLRTPHIGRATRGTNEVHLGSHHISPSLLAAPTPRLLLWYYRSHTSLASYSLSSLTPLYFILLIIRTTLMYVHIHGFRTVESPHRLVLQSIRRCGHKVKEPVLSMHWTWSHSALRPVQSNRGPMDPQATTG